MDGQKLTTIGIEMPGNFPDSSYEAIHERIVKQKDDFPEVWTQYAGAWNAVAYRFLSCTENNKNFILSVQNFGNAPPSSERYVQERELFGFFVNGLSAIESICFALFSIASIVDAESFPILTENDLKAIDPELTKDKLNSSTILQNESIAATLREVIDSPAYKEWKDIRNILAHRSAPGRHTFSGGNQNGMTLWIKGINIDIYTTSLRCQWLTKIIADILNDTDIFTSRLL